MSPGPNITAKEVKRGDHYHKTGKIPGRVIIYIPVDKLIRWVKGLFGKKEKKK